LIISPKKQKSRLKELEKSKGNIKPIPGMILPCFSFFILQNPIKQLLIFHRTSRDGKLVGAVTHVMVANPTEGYGIFIENMLSAAQQGVQPKAA
jgi:hypothetical protein